MFIAETNTTGETKSTERKAAESVAKRKRHTGDCSSGFFLLTQQMVAKELGISPNTVRAWMNEYTQTKGKRGLPNFWAGYQRKIRRSSLDAFLQRLERQTAGC